MIRLHQLHLLQKQYEVIILRLRKQPFKTKITPDWKLDWGAKYPLAKYPVRQKHEVHTFDIKEFVKNQKKKKLLEMMNAADSGEDNGGRGMPFGFPPMGDRMSSPPIPDFLTRKAPNEGERPTIPDFETFKRAVENRENERPTMPAPSPVKDDDDDDLGFDVDELVKKIDAKIAELEAEEKREKEKEEKNKKIEAEVVETKEVEAKPVEEKKESVTTPIKLDEEADDDFFDDFFDN